MYVIDTNLYIRAFNDAAFGQKLDVFQQAALPGLWVSAVVAFEVAVGASAEKQADDYERWLLRPFRQRGRLVVPTAQDWRLVAKIDRALRLRRGYVEKLKQRSFLNDMLIAAGCRSMGATLITANRADFELIDSVVGFRFRTSFPAL